MVRSLYPSFKGLLLAKLHFLFLCIFGEEGPRSVVKLSSFPHPQREVLVPPSMLGGISAAAHVGCVLTAEQDD